MAAIPAPDRGHPNVSRLRVGATSSIPCPNRAYWPRASSLFRLQTGLTGALEPLVRGILRGVLADSRTCGPTAYGGHFHRACGGLVTTRFRCCRTSSLARLLGALGGVRPVGVACSRHVLVVPAPEHIACSVWGGLEAVSELLTKSAGRAASTTPGVALTRRNPEFCARGYKINRNGISAVVTAGTN